MPSAAESLEGDETSNKWIEDPQERRGPGNITRKNMRASPAKRRPPGAPRPTVFAVTQPKEGRRNKGK